MLHTILMAAAVALVVMSRTVGHMTPQGRRKALIASAAALVVLLVTASGTATWVVAMAGTGFATWRFGTHLLEEHMVARAKRRAAEQGCACGAHTPSASSDDEEPTGTGATVKVAAKAGAKATAAGRKAARRMAHAAWKAATK
jgi:hypothetical protein